MVALRSALLIATALCAGAIRVQSPPPAAAHEAKADLSPPLRALAKAHADVEAVERQPIVTAADGKVQGGPEAREKGRSTGEDKSWSGETEHPFYEPSKRNRKKSGASARALSQTVVLVAASAALSQLF
mmetsp:Transcript_8355/g.22367  ORF Transcript_8355/g.22367 Transcript_8355/m.22367 type:complete len:129 (-) Transcript_8355:118-504(-)